MRTRKFLSLFLSVLLTVTMLTGCFDRNYSNKLEAAVDAVQELLDLECSGKLDQALRKALADYQSGEDLNVVRNRVIEELGLEDAIFFSSFGIRNARDGQHAVQVFRVEGGDADHAADQIATQIAEILQSLLNSGKYEGVVSMTEKDGIFYAVIDLHVIQAGNSDGNSNDTSTVLLKEISVTAQPDKTKYHVNESFNSTGMVVTATFSDGSTLDVTSECTITPTIFDTAGSTTVTIAYEDKTTTTTVTVIKLESIVVTTGPSKTEYTAGETFSTDGIVITAKYSDGSEQTGISDSITSDPENLTTTGDNITVTITYTNDYGETSSSTVQIKVNPVGIESDDDYDIPSNVVANVQKIFKTDIEKLASQSNDYTVNIQTDPMIQIRLNKAMEAYAKDGFPPNENKEYLREYEIPVVDLTNEFQDITELDQVQKYYYLGGITITRRTNEEQDLWNTIQGRISEQVTSLSKLIVKNSDDPYATNTYQFYINLSAIVDDSNLLNGKATIIIERIRTPKT